MNVVADSFSVLVDHARTILGLLFILLIGQRLVSSVLKQIFEDRLTLDAYFSLSLAGWVIPISLASLFWLALGVVQVSALRAFISLICLVIVAFVLFWRIRKQPFPGSKTFAFILFLLFGISVFLRLAFLTKAVVPLYFDSAQHYQVIKNLLRDVAAWPVAGYYHLGFHLLTAWIASVLGTDGVDTMLVLGQMTLAVIPISVFALVQHQTRSSGAALFAVLLAAVGWYMPAYAVNWGKYPALTSLPLIVFVISVAYLTIQSTPVPPQRTRLGSYSLLLIGGLSAAFIHSRSLVMFGIIGLAWILSGGWQKLSSPLRLVSVCAVLLGILLEISFIRRQDVFGPLFDPYWNQGWIITSFVLLLSIFAQRVYPRLAFVAILVIFFLLGSMFIPIRVPGYGVLTLLDRPFVEMILYLPLSLLGGLGLAGLQQSLQQRSPTWATHHLMPGRYLGILFSSALLAYAFANYTVYPADCCSIVGRDDLVAIDWMNKNLPPDARILISSTELRVLTSDSPQGIVSGDAGAWITPLTDRTTIFLPFQSDFTQQTTFDTLCQMQADYVYIGEMGATFNSAQLAALPDRYKVLLSMPKAQVYQVVGCS